jgi:hypothetical protein
MKLRMVIASVFLCSLLVPGIVFGQGAGRKRMVLAQLGAGFGVPSYPSEMSSFLAFVESYPGNRRVKVSLDLALGIAIGQQAFLLGRIDGLADRLEGNGGYMQVNTYLTSLGLRVYPQTTGFYVEAGLGSSKGVVQTSFAGDNSSDAGYGFGAALGYDFTPGATGFGLGVEAKYNSLSIEGKQYGQFMATVNLCMK